MRMYDIIERKRDGYELSDKEILFFVEQYTKGYIPDYQASALLMAIYFQGMTSKECTDLTIAMVQSGYTIDLSKIKGIKVDKHSTGGVGDKTSIALAPMVASLGVVVPKMSGRALGHTGGTIDKLESIRGFSVNLDEEQFMNIVNKHLIGIVGQTENLAPADKKLYSLRDVTATINSIPLIASSIMSKKIASGADRIVLDVKVGSGAFMKEYDQAKQLAKTMVSIGNQIGKQTVAILSNMDQPLGNAIGNALEIKEVIDVLNGVGPKDVIDLCLALGSQMVLLAKKAESEEEAKFALKQTLENGQALNKFKQFIKAQGGEERIVEDPSLLPQAKYQISVQANTSGIIQSMKTDEIGKMVMKLGAGRETKEAKIDLSVGVVIHKKIGEYVNFGDILFTIHTNTKNVDNIIEKLLNSIEITKVDIPFPKIVYEIIAE